MRLRLWLVVAMTLTSSLAAVAGDQRTVIDNERGGFFMYPFGLRWADLGADFGLRGPAYNYDAMPPLSIKGIHGRFQHFEQLEETNYSFFPYERLMEYEADEVAQGRPPIWVTASYQGKSRPVLFSWHVLGGWGNSQAVNIRDDRFIKFFIKQYCRGVLMDPYRQGWYIGLDNSSYQYGLYGVLDDAGKFVSAGVTWDAPFPQSSAEWMDAAQYAFDRIGEWAPDIQLITNEGSQDDESRYARVFRVVSGVIFEGLLGREPWARSHLWNIHFPRIIGSDREKIQIYQFDLTGEEDLETRLRTGYCLYSICRGPNAFFGPKGEGSVEADPARYAEARDAIGRPIAPAQTEQIPGKAPEYRLYWRECEGGLAYLNLTGAEKTVTLPPGSWFSRTGDQVTTLTLADYAGDYVTRTPGQRAAWPTINPRYAGVVTGPVPVTLTTEPWTAGTTIRYTLDGSEPTEQSPLYTIPLSLTENCMVSAKAFRPRMLPSFTTTARYRVQREAPSVSFHLAADSGSEFLDDYPLVSLSGPSGQTVTVKCRVIGGTAKAGEDFTLGEATIEFPPGERYRHFRLPVIHNRKPGGNRTVVIGLVDPVNASLGEHRTYTYTIEKRGGEAAPPSGRKG